MSYDARSCLRASVAFLISSAAASASAQAVPLGCREAKPRKAYQQALTVGKGLANVAWNRVHDCSRLEQFVDKVALGLAAYRPANRDLQLVCRYTGLLDGVFEGLGKAFAGCQNQCCLEGQLIGGMAGQLYCDLSILLQGLGTPDDFVRGPVERCGVAFQSCCDAEFSATSRNYVGKDSGGKSASCRPYTTGAYAYVWSDTRALECAYDLELNVSDE